MFLIKNIMHCHKYLNFNIQYKEFTNFCFPQTKPDNSDAHYRNICKALAYKYPLSQRRIESPVD